MSYNIKIMGHFIEVIGSQEDNLNIYIKYSYSVKSALLQLDFQNFARKLVIIAKIKNHKMSFTLNSDDV